MTRDGTHKSYIANGWSCAEKEGEQGRVQHANQDTQFNPKPEKS